MDMVGVAGECGDGTTGPPESLTQSAKFLPLSLYRAYSPLNYLTYSTINGSVTCAKLASISSSDDDLETALTVHLVTATGIRGGLMFLFWISSNQGRPACVSKTHETLSRPSVIAKVS